MALERRAICASLRRGAPAGPARKAAASPDFLPPERRTSPCPVSLPSACPRFSSARSPAKASPTRSPSRPRPCQAPWPAATCSAVAGRRGAPRRPRGLILAPTRELANQIAAVLEPLADAVGLRLTTIFGGVSQYRQDQALAAGVDIVVACPGRLEDLLKQRLLTLEAVEITVLDEADHMADLGFLPGVRRIMSATPARGQRMLFSATLDNGVDQIVKQFLHDPLRQSVDPEQSQIAEMTHHVFTVDGTATKQAVVEYLASGVGRRLLFTRTKHQLSLIHISEPTRLGMIS